MDFKEKLEKEFEEADIKVTEQEMEQIIKEHEKDERESRDSDLEFLREMVEKYM